MATMEYTREARCLDCKYYVPAPKPFTKSMCGLTEKPTNRKSLVCRKHISLEQLKVYLPLLPFLFLKHQDNLVYRKTL